MAMNFVMGMKVEMSMVADKFARSGSGWKWGGDGESRLLREAASLRIVTCARQLTLFISSRLAWHADA